MKTQEFQTHIQQLKTVIKHPIVKTVVVVGLSIMLVYLIQFILGLATGLIIQYKALKSAVNQ